MDDASFKLKQLCKDDAAFETLKAMFAEIDAEKQALESRLRIYESVVSTIHDRVSFINKNYVYEIVNNAYYDTYLGNSMSILGKSVIEVVGEKQFYDGGIKAHLDRCLAGEQVNFQGLFDYHSGPHHMDITYTPYYDDSGNITGVIANSKNITDKKQFEASIANQASLLDIIGDAVITTDQDFNIISFNRAAEAMYGWKQHEVIGKPLESVIQTIYSTGEITHAIDILFKQGFYSDDFVQTRRDGTDIIVNSTVSVMYDEAGKPTGVIAINRDITERRNTQSALQRSESRLISLLDSQTAYIVRTDMEGLYTYVNPRFIEQWGWISDHLIGQPALLTIMPEDHDKTIQTIYECIEKPGTAISVVLRKPAPGNNIYWTVWEFIAIADLEGNLTEIQCMGVDATALIHAEERMRLQDMALFATVNGVVIMNAMGIIEWANPAFTTLTGYTLDESIGKDPQNLIRSGLHDTDFYDSIRSTINAGKVWSGKIINRRKDGSVYTEQQTITPVLNFKDEITHFISIKEDVTEYELSEKLALEHERLSLRLEVETERAKFIQRVISALSHDLRTPMTVINTSVDILSKYQDRINEAKRQEKLTGIKKQVQFAVELLDDVVDVVRGNLNDREFNPKPINLANLCNLSIREVQTALMPLHNFKFIHEGDISVVSVDEVLISRILHNLLTNAVKYSPDGERITLSLAIDDDKIRICVADAGMGISEDDQKHIFDPFYRTNLVHNINGSGLGLSIVDDCVKRHHGTISVESKIGIGTTFCIELPIHQP